MSQPKKKSGGRYNWTLNTVDKLKPMVYAKEHISRRAAIKLIQPTTEWERRELDKLRARANKVIRGENIDILHYTIFGVTTRHPSMKGVMEDFDKNLKEEEAKAALSPDQQLFVYDKAYALVKEKVNGDCYVDDDGTAKVWYEGMFINCGVCHPAAVLNQGKPIPQLTFIKNVQGIGDLPDSARVGDMYGILNGNPRDAERYMLWENGHWIEIQQNPDTLTHIKSAVNIKLLEGFREHLERDMVRRFVDEHKVHESLRAYTKQAGIDRVKFVSELPTYGWLKEEGKPGELFDIADVEDIGIATVGWDGKDWVDAFDPTKKVPQRRYRAYNDQAPAARKNPVHVLFAASEEAAAVLESRYGGIKSKLGIFEGTTFVKFGNVWVEGRGYDAYNAIMSEELKETRNTFHSMSEEQALSLPVSDLIPGMAYLNKAGDIIVWANNEWANLGRVSEELGLWVDVTGVLCQRSDMELLARKLGCDITLVSFVDTWAELPDNPKKGDYHMLNLTPVYGDSFRAVWDGEVWVNMVSPHNPITLPRIAVPLPPMNGDVIDEVLKNDDRPVDWTFVEPKPNPTSIWSRIGRWLGFK